MRTRFYEKAQDYWYGDLSYLLRDTGFGNEKKLKEKPGPGMEYVMKIHDYMKNSYEGPLFIYGAKGCGKTLSAMAALGTRLTEDMEFLPVMLVYDTKRGPRPIDLCQLGPFEAVEERAVRMRRIESPRRMMEKADVIVYDDIHYRCQAAMESQNADALASDLEDILRYSSIGKKVVLLSEDPLALYVEKLGSGKLEELLPEFGEMPWWRFNKGSPEWKRMKEKQKHMSFVEYEDPSFESWMDIVSSYGVGKTKLAGAVLYSISKRPRSFVKMIGLFPGKSEISLEDVVGKARDMTVQSGHRLSTYEDMALRIPFVETGVDMDKFSDWMNHGGVSYLKDKTPFDEERENSLKGMVSMLREKSLKHQISKEFDVGIDNVQNFLVLYHLRRIEETRPLIVESIMDRYDLGKPKDIERMLYEYETVVESASDCVKNRKVLSKLREGLPGALQLQVSLFSKNLRNFYTPNKMIGGWLATEPIRRVMEWTIIEEPTLEILKRMSDLQGQDLGTVR